MIYVHTLPEMYSREAWIEQSVQYLDYMLDDPELKSWHRPVSHFLQNFQAVFGAYTLYYSRGTGTLPGL